MEQHDAAHVYGPLSLDGERPRFLTFVCATVLAGVL